MQSNAPSSMIDDTDEGSRSSDNLEDVQDGITNLESTGMNNVESNFNSVHLYELTIQREKQNDYGRRNTS